ncbi:hypothetical protein A2U01_0061566, partial [Trifolium medium]|nr:hypothetical protein [Trifolium medium]
EGAKKPIVISSELTSFEEEELLRKAKVVNDGFGRNFDGMIPIYCMHTPKSDTKEGNPVGQSQEVLIPSMQVLTDGEPRKVDETNNMDATLDNFRKASVHV